MGNDQKPITGTTGKPNRKTARNPKPISAETGKTEGEILVEPSFTVENVTAEKPAKAPPAEKPEKPASAKEVKTQKLLAEQNSIIIITLLDGLAMSMFGPEAAMNSIEKAMIEEPLQRIMERMNIFSQEAISKWTDPILLVMGLIGWSSRLLQLAKEKQLQLEVEQNERRNENPGKPGKPEITISPDGNFPVDIGKLTNVPPDFPKL